MKSFILVMTGAGLLSGSLWARNVSQSPSDIPSRPGFDLQADTPGTVEFEGSDSAILFSKEVTESFQGVLERDFVSHSDDKFPAGFLNASPLGQPWYGTMWTRDAGTFMRELVYWGYYQHACQVAQCIMDFVGTNSDGFISFPTVY